MVCLFVRLGFFVRLENLSLIWRHYHCRWTAANYDLYSVLMAIEQWGFYSLWHLMWHATSVYNSYLCGPVTFAPNAERLAVERSLPVEHLQWQGFNAWNYKHLWFLKIMTDLLHEFLSRTNENTIFYSK